MVRSRERLGGLLRFYRREARLVKRLARPAGQQFAAFQGPVVSKNTNDSGLCLLFLHPRDPNLIGLRSAGTMPT